MVQPQQQFRFDANANTQIATSFIANTNITNKTGKKEGTDNRPRSNDTTETVSKADLLHNKLMALGGSFVKNVRQFVGKRVLTLKTEQEMLQCTKPCTSEVYMRNNKTTAKQEYCVLHIDETIQDCATIVSNYKIVSMNDSVKIEMVESKFTNFIFCYFFWQKKRYVPAHGSYVMFGLTMDNSQIPICEFYCRIWLHSPDSEVIFSEPVEKDLNGNFMCPKCEKKFKPIADGGVSKFFKNHYSICEERSSQTNPHSPMKKARKVAPSVAPSCSINMMAQTGFTGDSLADATVDCISRHVKQRTDVWNDTIKMPPHTTFVPINPQSMLFLPSTTVSSLQTMLKTPFSPYRGMNIKSKKVGDDYSYSQLNNVDPSVDWFNIDSTIDFPYILQQGSSSSYIKSKGESNMDDSILFHELKDTDQIVDNQVLLATNAVHREEEVKISPSLGLLYPATETFREESRPQTSIDRSSKQVRTDVLFAASSAAVVVGVCNTLSNINLNFNELEQSKNVADMINCQVNDEKLFLSMEEVNDLIGTTTDNE